MSSMFDKFPPDQKIPGFLNGFDTRRQMEEANHDATERLVAEMCRQDKQREERIREGLPALQRLAKIAQGDHGQARHCRRILLALFNGFEWPLDMRRLRALDADLQQAAVAVIELDWCGKEVHTYIDGGDEMFQQFWKLETPVIEDEND